VIAACVGVVLMADDETHVAGWDRIIMDSTAGGEPFAVYASPEHVDKAWPPTPWLGSRRNLR
jgi:hypothetical protein